MAATKIVIVSGQEFQVPADTDNEAIRQHLAQSFPDVATATIQTGKKTIDGQQYETIEFVKKAGTKGLDGAALAELLAEIPPAQIVTPSADERLLDQLLAGALTFADLHDRDVAGALERQSDTPRQQPGVALCRSIDQVPAAAVQPRGW